MNAVPPLIPTDSKASVGQFNTNVKIIGELQIGSATPGTLQFITEENTLASTPYSSVNSTTGQVTMSRINLTGYGDVALTSAGLVQATTLQAQVLSSPGTFTANSFFTPKIGFYGTTPIVQQTLTVGVSTVDDVINFLKNIGLSG